MTDQTAVDDRPTAAASDDPLRAKGLHKPERSFGLVLHDIVDRVIPAGWQRDVAHDAVEREYSTENDEEAPAYRAPAIATPLTEPIPPVAQSQQIDYNLLAAAIVRAQNAQAQQLNVPAEQPEQPVNVNE